MTGRNFQVSQTLAKFLHLSLLKNTFKMIFPNLPADSEQELSVDNIARRVV
jgi:hypothetical protein